MPLLRMAPNGTIYEVDSRFDHTTLPGRIPTLGADGNMQSLSVVEKPEVLRDRVKVAKAEQAQKIASLKRKIVETKVREAVNRKIFDLESSIHKKLQMADRLKTLRENATLLRAVKQKGQDYELMSGVSGFGGTADGLLPYTSKPDMDYPPIVKACMAFGDFEQALAELSEEEKAIISAWQQNVWTDSPGADPDAQNFDGVMRSKWMKAMWQKMLTDKWPSYLETIRTNGYGYAGFLLKTETNPDGIWTELKVPYESMLPMWDREGWGERWHDELITGLNVLQRKPLTENDPFVKLIRAFNHLQNLQEQESRKTGTYSSLAQYVTESEAAKRIAALEAQLRAQAEKEKSQVTQVKSIAQNWWEYLLKAGEGFMDLYLHPMLRYGLVHKK